MHQTLSDLLYCPDCQGSVSISRTDAATDGLVLAGELGCGECGRTFPVVDGVPHMDMADPATAQEHVASSFGFEWNLYHEGKLETGDTLWGRNIEEDVTTFCDALEVESLGMKGKRVLDAGCGSGFLTLELARRFPDAEFVGMDINPSLGKLYRKARGLRNLHVVCGSIFEIPFPDASFDYIWCNGVIHHTGDTRRAFDSLVRKLKTAGRAYVWVYQKKLSPMVALRSLLMPLGLTSWNHAFLYRFCQVITLPTWLAVKVLALLGRIPVTQRYTHGRILLRDRGFNELVLTWFDVLSPRYRDTYTKFEFENWFRETGFEHIKHHWYPVGVSGTKR